MILGASFDSPDDNQAFAQDQQFPFLLLSDEDRRAGQAYEVTRPPGERYSQFPRRLSYLIGPDGVIRRAYDVTDVGTHAEVVLADIDRLSPRPLSP